jgi:hypothetical protein
VLAEELRGDEVSGEDEENARTQISVELEDVRVGEVSCAGEVGEQDKGNADSAQAKERGDPHG